MFTHNLDPILFSFGFLSIRWYSLSYIFGILIGWWLGKKIINHILKRSEIKFKIKDFDDLITYIVISIIIGGRLGYVIFYNPGYFISHPVEILKVWEGGMSFHGALIGLVCHLLIFSHKNKQDITELANLLAFSGPVGIFLGRIANFINGELVGRATNGSWGVIYKFDNLPRHPSQLYEAFFEGLVIFTVLFIFSKSELKKKLNAFSIFLILYSLARFFVEFFREPDSQLGFIFYNFSMGQILTLPMLMFGCIFLINEKNK